MVTFSGHRPSTRLFAWYLRVFFSDKRRNLPFDLLKKQVSFAGPSDRIRTCGLMVPKSYQKLFLLVFDGFSLFCSVSVTFQTSISRCFPCVPHPSVVINVVKNASRPVSGEHSPVPGRKRFAFRVSCRSYCNSASGVMQVISTQSAAQNLRGNKQRNRLSGISYQKHQTALFGYAAKLLQLHYFY